MGAFCFGLVIGWFTYFVNRYRSTVVLGDVATIIGAVGGAAVLALFPEGSSMFDLYGIGLAVGFFAYFLVLVVFVILSPGWSLAWFLDGRRPRIDESKDTDSHPGGRPNRGMANETARVRGVGQ